LQSLNLPDMDEISKTDKKTLQTIQNKFKKAINDYRLIDNDDHILIGLSGGKDSLALVLSLRFHFFNL